MKKGRPPKYPPRQPLVYALTEPDGNIRYIGQTVQKLATRLRQHKNVPHVGNKKLQRWIDETDFQISPLLAVEKGDLDRAEQRAIQDAIDKGADLLNISAGGHDYFQRRNKITSPADSPPLALLDSELARKVLANVEKARRHFGTFLSLMVKWTPAEHQKEWATELQDIAEGKNLELLIVAPRGSGKSTVVGILFVVWMIGRNPNGHFGLLCYADRPAWQRAKAIRRIIESHPVYHLIFPGIHPDVSDWSRGSLTIQREDLSDPHPTLLASGATSAVISYRLDGLVFDDPHNLKNSATNYQRLQVIENFDEAIAPCFVQDTWTACIATRYAEDDLPGKFISRGFRLIHQRAILAAQYRKKGTRSADGLVAEHSYWPERYSLEWLKEKRGRNPRVFAFAYQGDTSSAALTPIKRLTTYESDELPPLKELLIAAGADLNYSDKETKTADYCVIYTGGLDIKGNIWILDRIKNREDIDDLTDTIINLHARLPFFTLFLEDAGKASPAVTVLRRKMPSVPVELITTQGKGGKWSRASALAPYVNNGQVKFPVAAEWFQDAKYYMTHRADHDDDMDALFHLVFRLTQNIHPANYGQGRPTRKVRFGKRR